MKRNKHNMKTASRSEIWWNGDTRGRDWK